MDNSEAPSVPASVFDDLEEHPDLIQRWVNDLEFREGVLRAEDPGAAVTQLSGIPLREDTKAWINERVRARTPEGLLDFSRPIPF